MQAQACAVSTMSSCSWYLCMHQRPPMGRLACAVSAYTILLQDVNEKAEATTATVL